MTRIAFITFALCSSCASAPLRGPVTLPGHLMSPVRLPGIVSASDDSLLPVGRDAIEWWADNSGQSPSSRYTLTLVLHDTLRGPTSGGEVGARAWTQGRQCIVDINARVWATLNDGARQRVVAHEIGHCLGLSHVDDRWNLMFYRHSGVNSDRLDQRQIDAVQRRN